MGNISSVEYAQICHDPCKVKNVTTETMGHPNMINCLAMKNNFCVHCKHNFREHMHIHYTSVPHEYDAEDETVKNDIKTNEDAQADIDLKIGKINDSIKEYKKEQEVIQDAMAKFAHFLKRNAITPINDAYKDIIVYYIRMYVI